MFLYRLTHGVIGNIDGKVFLQRFQNVIRALKLVQEQTVVIRLHRNLHEFIEEVILLHGLQKFHVFNTAVQHRTSVRRNQRIQEIEAAFNGTLEKRPGILAQEIRHVVGADFHRTGARCAKPDGKTSGKIQKRFRHIVADGADTQFSFLLGSADVIIRNIQQQLLQLIKMFQVSHAIISIFCNAVRTP